MYPEVWMCRAPASRPRMLMSPEENGAATVKVAAEKPASTVVSARLDGFATASKASPGSVTCKIPS